MSEKFFKPDSDTLRLLYKIRSRHYPDFAKAKIITLMRNGKWSKYGTISRVSESHRQAGIDGDYILTLSALAWDTFTTKQKKALIDHELAHMVRTIKGKKVQWKLRHHDLEEFCSIVQRYGEWSPSITRFRKALDSVEDKFRKR